MWVEYWINKAHPSTEDIEVFAEKYDKDRWICTIELPLINKTVKSISYKQVNAMLNASNKAAKLIDEYMKEHPELHIVNKFKGKRWVIASDETGKYISTGMSNAWRREQGKQMEKMINSSFETIKKAINKLGKINGSNKNLFVQVLDQSLFDDEMTINEITESVGIKVQNEYPGSLCTVRYDKDSGSVIVIGYTLPSLKKGELD